MSHPKNTKTKLEHFTKSIFLDQFEYFQHLKLIPYVIDGSVFLIVTYWRYFFIQLSGIQNFMTLASKFEMTSNVGASNLKFNLHI